MTVFDELAETDGDNEFKAWLSRVIDAKQDIVRFVACQINGDTVGQFDCYLKGSFNLGLVVKFNDEGPKAVIRFPKPGHTATEFREEKVRNEVHVLKFLSEETTIPVPRVLSWGTEEESPQKLGPFIIMEYMEGTLLADLLKEPTASGQEEVVLATNIDDTKLDYVYEQLADYMLQLSYLNFPTIGAITKSPSSPTWTATNRPLTYNMNELKTVVSAYPTTNFPTTSFTSAQSFFHSLADEHILHLYRQRNLADDQEDARKRYIALIPRYSLDDTGSFKLFCDDLQPTNMLADPATLRVTAVLDWEFTNAMPAQFSFDPPWWLLLLGPDMWLERHSMEEFTRRYVPRMKQFIRALERVEGRGGVEGRSEVRLSGRMREGWETGRFWFDYGVRKSFDVDAVYWGALHEGGDEVMSEEARYDMERLVEVKMGQLKEYDEKCRRRFG